jgi:hypothetical protein
MKLHLNQISSAIGALEKCSTKVFPIKVSYAMARNFKVLAREAQLVEEERRKLCEKYADKDQDGNPAIDDGSYRMSSENRKQFAEEYADLLGTEIEADIIKISLGEIERGEETGRFDGLTLEELSCIEFMIMTEG